MPVQSRFLSLPFEIKELIYSFCYVGPFPIEKAGQGDEDILPARKKQRLGKKAVKERVHNHGTKCTYPTSHLSLGLVCHQIRNEFYPTYARHHVLGISDPTIFANEYLYYITSNHQPNLRHIKMTMGLDLPPCNPTCKDGYHTCVTTPPTCNVDCYLRGLTNVLGLYPKIFIELESLHLCVKADRLFYYKSESLVRDAFFRNTILLLKKLDQISRRLSRQHSGENASGKERQQQRKFIVSPKNYQDYRTDWYNGHNASAFTLKICAVSNDVWSKISDGQTIHSRGCGLCFRGARDQPVGRSRIDEGHDQMWEEWEQTMHEIETETPGFSVESKEPKGKAIREKCWKSLFFSDRTRHQWSNPVQTWQQRLYSGEALKRSNGRIW